MELPTLTEKFIYATLPDLIQKIGAGECPAPGAYKKFTVEVRKAGVNIIFEPYDISNEYCCRYSASFAAVERAYQAIKAAFPKHVPFVRCHLLRIVAEHGHPVVFETQAHMEE